MLLGPQKPLNQLLAEIRRKAGRESLPNESGRVQVKAIIAGVEVAITVTSETRGPDYFHRNAEDPIQSDTFTWGEAVWRDHGGGADGSNFDSTPSYQGPLVNGDQGIATLNAAFLQFGLIANRPAAGNRGVLYFATDEPSWYYDNGSSWQGVNHGQTHTHSTLG